MAKLIDLTDKRFGKLKVIKISHKDEKGNIYWECQCDCGNKKAFYGGGLRAGIKHCGCLKTQKGSNNNNWKGGQSKQRGYIVLTAKHDHPNSNNQGQILEHIYVMSEYLDRPLEKGEMVHHKNGIRNDNRIENLELCTKDNHPPGQRVSDMLKFCKEYIKKYEGYHG